MSKRARDTKNPDRRTIRRRANEARIEWRNRLSDEERASIPRVEWKGTLQEFREGIADARVDRGDACRGREALRKTEPKRIASFDDDVAPTTAQIEAAKRARGPTGVLQRHAEGLAHLEPWLRWFRFVDSTALDLMRTGGSHHLAVDRAFRRVDGQFAPRGRRDPVWRLEALAAEYGDPTAILIDEVPKSVRSWHVVHGVGEEYFCEGCDEALAGHPRRLRWTDVVRDLRDQAEGYEPYDDIRRENDQLRRAGQWLSGYELGYERRAGYLESALRYDGPEPPDWIDAAFYPMSYVAEQLRVPEVTVLAQSQQLPHVDRFIRRDGAWALIDAHVAGILGGPHFPHPISRVETPKKRREAVRVNEVFGDSDGDGGLLVLAEDLERRTSKHRFWLCHCLWCDAGRKSVRQDHLMSFRTTSCGCREQENKREYKKKVALSRSIARRSDD